VLNGVWYDLQKTRESRYNSNKRKCFSAQDMTAQNESLSSGQKQFRFICLCALTVNAAAYRDIQPPLLNMPGFSLTRG